MSDGRVVRVVMAAAKDTVLLPLFGCALLAALFGSGILAARNFFPATTTYVGHIRFTFPDASEARYPNGTRFSLNEIIDPAILSRVYDDLHLQRERIPREQFMSAFGIRPYNPVEPELVQHFRGQLTDPHLTPAERQRAEKTLRSALDSASRTQAEISFFLQRSVAIPDELGHAIVEKVPMLWSKWAIETRGVLRPEGASTTDHVYTLVEVESEPLPLAIVSVADAFQQLVNRIARMRGLEGKGTYHSGIGHVRDARTGWSIEDIDRNTQKLALLAVNPLQQALVRYDLSKNPGGLQAVIESHVQDLGLAVRRTRERIASASNSVKEYVDAIATLDGRGGAEQPASAAAAGTGFATVPAVGISQLERVVAMQNQNRPDEESFVARAVSERALLDHQEIALLTERERWNGWLQALKAGHAREPLDDATNARLAAALRNATEVINAHWAALTRIETQFGANQLLKAGRLYDYYGSPGDVRRFDPILNMRVLVALAAFLIGAFLLLWILQIGGRLKTKLPI